MPEQVEQLAGEDDGLPIPDVGSWAMDKYRLVGMYSRLFSTGMKYKWDRRVFIDLYAGGGYSRIRRTANIVLGSPLIALTLPDPFTDYIFCEENSDLLEALKLRARKLAPGVNPAFVAGDCNSKIGEILSHIPVASTDQKVLTLCFVDPFNLEGVRFETFVNYPPLYGFLLFVSAPHGCKSKL